MPVVISTLNAFTGLSAAATGVALNNTALIVAGMIVGASGTLLTQQMAVAMNRTITVGAARRLRRRGHRRGRRPAAPGGTVRATSAADVGDPDGLRPPGRRRPRLRHGRLPGPARGARDGQAAGGQGRRGQVRDPPGRRAHARPHERAARRGRRALRAAQGDGRHQRRVRRAPTSRWSSAPTTSPTPTRATRPTRPIYGMPILNVDESASRSSCSSAR